MQPNPSIYEKVRRQLDAINPEKGLLILGFGREGRSSYKLFRSVFPDLRITIADRNDQIRNDESLKNDSLAEVITGEDYLKTLYTHPVVLKTPGISFKEVKDIPPGILITSQTDLFLRMFGHHVTGVTGTKGKSTTTALIHHILKSHNPEALLGGNIGIPPFELLADMRAHTPVVMEISSHQLEYVKASPHIAVFLNLYQEHLDHFTSYQAYQESKLYIARYQTNTDFLVYNQDDPLVRSHLEDGVWNSRLLAFSNLSKVVNGCYTHDGSVIFRDDSSETTVMQRVDQALLRGKHNVLNILAACLAAIHNGIPFAAIEAGVLSFHPLRHRLEEVGAFHGITFFNDSISTIPEATMQAVETLGRVDTLILGGHDRGIDYSNLVSFLKGASSRHLLLTGDAGKRILDLMIQAGYDKQRLHFLACFDDFIEVVRQVAQPGSICLLSPAASSYNEFRNFEERGDRFIELIMKW